MAKREVIAHRIVRIEPAKRDGDVVRHFPARAGVARQTEAAADADDVRVERDDEPGGRHTRPDAKVERVASNHPAKKQIQTLAARSGGRTRKEVADACPPLRSASVDGGQIEIERAR